VKVEQTATIESSQAGRNAKDSQLTRNIANRCIQWFSYLKHLLGNHQKVRNAAGDEGQAFADV